MPAWCIPIICIKCMIKRCTRIKRHCLSWLYRTYNSSISNNFLPFLIFKMHIKHKDRQIHICYIGHICQNWYLTAAIYNPHVGKLIPTHNFGTNNIRWTINPHIIWILFNPVYTSLILKITCRYISYFHLINSFSILWNIFHIPWLCKYCCIFIIRVTIRIHLQLARWPYRTTRQFTNFSNKTTIHRIIISICNTNWNF